MSDGDIICESIYNAVSYTYIITAIERRFFIERVNTVLNQFFKDVLKETLYLSLYRQILLVLNTFL